MNTLIDFDSNRPRWTGGTLPVLYDGARQCGRCSGGLLVELDPWVVAPLFYHGGYGEATRLSAAVCLACGRTSELRRESLNPRHL